MSFRIHRGEFLDLLGRIEPGLSPKDTVEQSSCVVMKDGWLVSYNEEICCRTRSPFPADVTGAVAAKPLVHVLGHMADDEVDIDITDREFRIRGRKKRAGVRMQSEILLPVGAVESPPTGAWRAVDKDFWAGVRQVSGASGTKDEEFITVCVHMHPDYLECCDRIQACRYTVPTGVSRPVLVRTKSITRAVDLDLIRMAETDNWVHFRNKSVVFSCRRHVEDFPSLDDRLAVRGTPIELPNELKQAADLTGGVGDDPGDKLDIRLTDGWMHVRGEGALAWATQEVECAYRGDDIRFRATPAMLESLVEKRKQCEVSPRRFRVDGDRWVWLTVLFRSADAEPAAARPAGESDAEPG